MLKKTLAVLLLALGLQAGVHAAACPPGPEMPEPAALQAAQARAQDRGLLWRLSKAGRSVAYLYGSIHVGKLDWAVPGPRLAAALRDSDTLALELDPGDPAVQQQLAAGLARRPLSPDPALRARLARLARAACLPEGALAGQHPLMQAFTLTLLAARWEGLDAGYAQEQVLSGLARAQQRPVLSLETPEQQLAALLPAERREALRMTQELLDLLEQGKARPVLRRLAEAWARSDLQALEDYEQWCECVASEADRAQLRRLNDARNPALAARIDALIGQGHRLFAAVGALHMTGPQSLTLLLEQRGYQVERLQ
jgi:hypothetical protein